MHTLYLAYKVHTTLAHTHRASPPMTPHSLTHSLTYSNLTHTKETLYGMTTTQAAGLVSVMLISYGVASPLWGMLNDRTMKWHNNDWHVHFLSF